VFVSPIPFASGPGLALNIELQYLVWTFPLFLSQEEIAFKAILVNFIGTFFAEKSLCFSAYFVQ
jgi:hypothetical protein